MDSLSTLKFYNLKSMLRINLVSLNSIAAAALPAARCQRAV